MELIKRVGLFFLDSLQTLLIIASVLMVLYAFVIQPNEVSGSSMYPTFKNKEYLLSSLIDIRLDKYKRGDVIVFHSPVDNEKLFIKRVIGLPGDRIRLENGDVYLNGVLLDESAYLAKEVKTYGGSFLPDGVEITVPSGTVFVMGDNRPYSSDSREWGFLKKSDVVGKSVARILPLTEFKIIQNPFDTKQ